MRAGARLVSVLALLLAGCGDAPLRVRVEAPDGGVALAVTADEAITAAERMAGLAALPPLREGEGLLLEFPVEGEVCLVNEGVAYAIDAVYADSAGRVAAIERAIPPEDSAFHCRPGTRTVLEVLAGAASAVAPDDTMVRSRGP
jgi:uncharacterized membrane protein (UPF0127 family)